MIFILISIIFVYNFHEVSKMLYFLLGVAAVVLVVMLLKKVLHLRVDDQDYSDNDDYLERRVKKDDEDK